MIVFAPLRTSRLDVRLREMSIGDEIALCHMPESNHESALSEFLKRAIGEAFLTSPRHVVDPRAWTVSERLVALAQYNVHARADGPDYNVTTTSHISDYLDGDREPMKPTKFQAAGDEWFVEPMIGAVAEIIESKAFDSDLKGVEHWVVGAMAAQLMREEDIGQVPDAIEDGSGYQKWFSKRMDTMRAMPSSSMDDLYAGFTRALDADTQFFRLWFDESGIIVLPKKEVAGLVPAARFLVFSCIGDLALFLTGKSQ